MGGPELRERRERLGLTQERLADILGLAPNTVAVWERGEKTPAHPRLLDRALRDLEWEYAAEPVLTRRVAHADNIGEYVVEVLDRVLDGAVRPFWDDVAAFGVPLLANAHFWLRNPLDRRRARAAALDRARELAAEGATVRVLAVAGIEGVEDLVWQSDRPAPAR